MISQLMTLLLSHSLHAYMVQPPAEKKPELAKDGTRIVELMPYDELIQQSPEEVEAYLERARKSVLYFEEHVSDYLPESEKESARFRLDWRRLMQSMVLDEAAAAPISPDTFGRAKDKEGKRSSKPAAKSQTTPVAAKPETAAKKTGIPDKAAKPAKAPGFAPADYDPNRKEDFRCFYAGWAVTKPKCEGEKSVEWTYAEGFTDKTAKTTLKCSGDQTLCNPAVFGVTRSSKRSPSSVTSSLTVESKARVKAKGEKPETPLNTSVPQAVCVPSASKRNLSKACYWKARDLGAKVDVAHNRALYDKFKAGFDSMCTKGVTTNAYYAKRTQAITEMKNTCTWIAAAMNGENLDGKHRKNESTEGAESSR